jgi:hypothetical protein
MVRERCPELLRSSGANHLALRKSWGFFVLFIVVAPCIRMLVEEIKA